MMSTGRRFDQCMRALCFVLVGLPCLSAACDDGEAPPPAIDAAQPADGAESPAPADASSPEVSESNKIILYLTGWTANGEFTHIDNSQGTIFRLSELPERFTAFVAIPNDPPSFVYELDGHALPADNIPPFYMAEDATGVPPPWKPTAGIHVIKATSYGEKDGKGPVIDSVSRTYTFLP
jgi:hypothetical protein